MMALNLTRVLVTIKRCETMERTGFVSKFLSDVNSLFLGEEKISADKGLSVVFSWLIVEEQIRRDGCKHD